MLLNKISLFGGIFTHLFFTDCLTYLQQFQHHTNVSFADSSVCF
nr:MAG TPA: hypothetical protein [Caudoviricetes sp.]